MTTHTGPGSWLATFIVAALEWNSTPLLDWTRFIPGLSLGLIGLGITVRGYFNLGLGNTYCGTDGLVTGGLYRFSRNPQYTASIAGLIGLSIGANSLLTIALATLIVAAYVMMAMVEEDWLKQLYGAPYRDYCMQTARFLDIQGLLALADRRPVPLAPDHASRRLEHVHAGAVQMCGLGQYPPEGARAGLSVD